MDIFINYLIKNKEWIFSGLGTEIVGFIRHFVMRKKSDKKLDINNTKLEDINNVCYWRNYFFNKNIDKSSQESISEIYETN